MKRKGSFKKEILHAKGKAANKAYEIVTYGVGSLYLEEGWHSIEDLKKQIKLMEKRSSQLAKDVQKTVEDRNAR